MRKYLLNKKFVWTMAVWMALLSLPPSNALAFPSQSVSAVGSVSSREAQMQKVIDALSGPQAQVHMRLMHMDSAQVREMLTKLDDAELAQVSQKSGFCQSCRRRCLGNCDRALGDRALGCVDCQSVEQKDRD